MEDICLASFQFLPYFRQKTQNSDSEDFTAKRQTLEGADEPPSWGDAAPEININKQFWNDEMDDLDLGRTEEVTSSLPTDINNSLLNTG